MYIENQLEAINSRDDLATWIDQLRQDYLNNPVTWENRDLPAYLEALSAWLRDMDGYYARMGRDMPNAPTWQLIGEILLAAKMYE